MLGNIGLETTLSENWSWRVCPGCPAACDLVQPILKRFQGRCRIVGGSTLPLVVVASWRFRVDTDRSWVATKSPTVPLRSADGRTK